ncbi:hypothetical protein Y032_0025g1104 [Ancylostoma ceylanicum]|uniref:Uncharacterized protein n=1 Tax=Ancylostoma ceylanicum TaxID=53326 RepID=A0A016UU82_9BILA|nr:hypothetical protein Y032_0025g1104 [Ancylostoma ceylanicum]
MDGKLLFRQLALWRVCNFIDTATYCSASYDLGNSVNGEMISSHATFTSSGACSSLPVCMYCFRAVRVSLQTGGHFLHMVPQLSTCDTGA